MTELAIIRDLLCDELFCDISEIHGRPFVHLKERDTSAKLVKIDLLDVPKGSMVVNLDESKSPAKSLFKKSCGQRRCCDYVIVTKKEGRKILLFIEMKSAKQVDVRDVKQQFRGAECIIDYCDATLKRFHANESLSAQVEKRFVVFYRPNLAKRGTRPIPIPIEARGKNTTPDNMLKYPAPHFPSINSLI